MSLTDRLSGASLLLVRHGAIDGLDRLVGRTPGVRLNAEGRCQVAELAIGFRGLRAYALRSSPQPRAVETAEALAPVLGLHVEIWSAFDEIDFGRWTAQPFRALEADEDWRCFNAHRSGARIPGGEAMDAVLVRVRQGLVASAAEARGRPVVIVTHAEIVRCAIMAAFGLSLEHWPRLPIGTASVTAVVADAGGRRAMIDVSGIGAPSWRRSLRTRRHSAADSYDAVRSRTSPA